MQKEAGRKKFYSRVSDNVHGKLISLAVIKSVRLHEGVWCS